MFPTNPTNNYSSTFNNTNPCSSILSNSNGNSNFNNYQPASCYRPLQQLYKTVYSPTDGKNSLHMNIACICRPAERYKTTNMTYGSFYYDNSMSTEKNQAINYDKAAFARCYDNNKKMGYQSTGNTRAKDTSIISNINDPQESQYWTQSTNDACCPTDCCNNTTYNTANCVNRQNSTPYNTPFSQKIAPSYSDQMPVATNKSSNIQVRCV